MNHDDHSLDRPSEDEVIELLGTYGDALEAHATLPAAHGAPAASGAWAGEVAEELAETDVFDLNVDPVVQAKPARARLLVGALAAVAALVVGGVVIANQNSGTDLDVAAEGVEDNSSEDVGETVPPSNAPADDAATSGLAATSEQADEFLGFGFGQNSVIFDDGEFVSVGSGPDGVVAARSQNGTDWSTSPINGVPEDSIVNSLARTDSGWVTVIEAFPESVGPFFGVNGDVDRFLATSPDLVEWTVTDFPEIDIDDDESAFVSGLAGSRDRFAVLLGVQPQVVDELEVLFEAGVLNEADLENYCGFDTDGDALVGISCGDFDDFGVDAQAEALEEADAVAEAEALEDLEVGPVGEASGEELFRLEPGDPGYDELNEVLESQRNFDISELIVVSGPIGGPFETTELPSSGFGGPFAGSDQGFVATIFGASGSEITTSPDGVAWSAPTAIDFNLSSLVVAGDQIVAVSQSFDSPDGGFDIAASNDAGATWTTVPLDSELFSAFGMISAGPAGFAVGIEGSLEPFEDPFASVGDIAIERDGFTLSFGLSTGIATLTGPDGLVIHDSVALEQLDIAGGELANVVRADGPFDENLVWLDPDTGVDLVTFTQADFDAAFDEVFEQSPDAFADDFNDQQSGFEVWFSADGLTWELIESGPANDFGSSTVAGVGDDEVILRSENFSESLSEEPPAELFAFEQEGRDPTEEEIDAIDDFFAQTNSESNVEWTAIPVS